MAVNIVTLDQAEEVKQRIAKIAEEKGEVYAGQVYYKLFSDPANFPLFCYIVLPHYFFREFKPVHYDTMHFHSIGVRDGKSKAQMAYRGHAKTTIAWVAATIYETCYGVYRHVVLNAYDETMCIDRLRLVKEEFEVNDTIKFIYGDPILDKENWNKKDITVFNNVRIRTMSAGQNPRGLLTRFGRPDKIMTDDILKDDNVRSEDQRIKLSDWFRKALMPTLAPGGINVALNTPMHPDDLVMEIFKKQGMFKKWNTLIIEAMKDGKSVDEDWKTTEELLDLAEDELTFASEYMCKPVLLRGGLVMYENLRFWDDLPNIGGRMTIKDVCIHCDTTHTGKTTSDFFCIGAIGECSQSKEYFVTDYILKKADVAQQAKLLINFYLKQKHFFNVRKITYDEKANQGFGYWLKKMAREEYNLSLPIEELEYPNDKIAHFTPHLPHFKSNRIILPKVNEASKQALDQLLAFPNKAVNDDFVDMLSGCLDEFKSEPTIGLENFSIG